MTEKFSARIKEYCESAGIETPIGFHRHSASRYAVIALDTVPHKLVAKTWFKQEDLAYYLENLATGKPVKILDFKTREELFLDSKGGLKRGQSF